MSRQLIIVYNANAGLLAGAMDSIHKLVAPATYPCKLCALTYGLLTMQSEWRRFLDGLDMEIVFHHRPDFRTAFPHAADWSLPMIAVEDGGTLAPLVGAADFAAIADLSTLMATVQQRLQPPAGASAAP